MRLAFLLALTLAGCSRPAPAPAPRAADIEGTVTSDAYYERAPGGKGGLARINDSIDWAMPRPRHASVRVWFRGAHTTPVNDETFAKADIVSFDAMPRVDRGAFVVTLGRDTVSAESFERAGNHIAGQIVRRIPRTEVVGYHLTLSPAGQPQLLEYRTVLPDGSLVPNGSESIAVTYRADSAITELRRVPPVRRAAAAAAAFPGLDGSVLFFWLPVNALRASGADSMSFMVHEPGSTSATPTAVARGDDRRYWVYYFGSPMEIAVNEHGDMQSMTADVGAARIAVRYGRPSARGRAIWSERGVLGDTLWRTGANAATRLVTSADISFGGRRLPAGTYVVTTLAIPGRYQLILSAEGREVLRVPLTARSLAERVEQFTILVEPIAAGAGRIALQWDDRELAADFTATGRAP